MQDNIMPVFRVHHGEGYHGTSPDSASQIVEEQKLNPSTNRRCWYGRGCYLYEHGAYKGWESAEHYVRVIKERDDCAVVKATFEAEKCLDFNVHANFEYLTKTLFPALITQLKTVDPEKLQDLRLQHVLKFLLEKDPEIDAIRGTSYEGKEFKGNPKNGKYYPGNILLDVQMILCIRNENCIKALTLCNSANR